MQNSRAAFQGDVSCQNAKRRQKDWFLVQKNGTMAFRLSPHHSIILVGTDHCDINIQSPGVDKRHAVLCYDPNSERFSVKDLNSTHGTFLNHRRISSDQPEPLDQDDLLRFGYGPEVHQDDRPLNYHPQQVGRAGGSDIPFGGNTTPQASQVMQQTRGSLAGSRSPSLTLDSGHGSSSSPSSPAKEMSPVPGTSTPSFNAKPDPASYSSNLSNRMKTDFDSKRLASASSRQSENQSPLVRKDSLEDEMDQVLDKIMYPSNKYQKESEKLAAFTDLDVPNEIFSDQMDPTERKNTHEGEEEKEFAIPSSRQDCTYFTPTSNAATPLYGTPRWWPREGDFDESLATKDAGSTETDGDTSSESRRKSLLADSGPVSLNSEGNLSMDSDTSVERKKISPMAFTIDFDDGPKKFGISDSISKFAPKHRRSASGQRGELTPAKNKDISVNKAEPTSLTSCDGVMSNNKSVIESGNDVTERNNVSKNFSTRLGRSAFSPNTPRGEIKAQPESETERLRASSKRVESKTPSSKLLPQNSPSLSRRDASPMDYRKQKNSVPATMFSRSNEVKNGSKSKKDIPKDLDKDIDDASSEAGTYTVDKDNEEPSVEKARKDIAKLMVAAGQGDGQGGSSLNSSAPEWIREWAEQAAIQQKKIKQVNPDSDTQLFLRETENVVSAMQARVTRTLSNNNSSRNSDSDEEASHLRQAPKPNISNVLHKRPVSLRTMSSPLSSPMRLPREASVLSDSGYQVGYQSDSSNDGLRDYRNIGTAKMNKAFSIRRDRAVGVGYDSDGCAMAWGRQNATPILGRGPCVPNLERPFNGNVPVSSVAPFSRNDGGRFSLRMSKGKPPTGQMAPPLPPIPRTASKAPAIGVASRVDSNVRRQTPNSSGSSSNPGNPRKPPAPAKGSRSNSTLTAKEVELANWRRRKSYDPMRAAAESKKRGSQSAAETSIDDISPTSLSKQSAGIMSKSMSFHNEPDFLQKSPSDEEDIIYVVDEMDSSHSNSPIHIPMTRPRPYEDQSQYGMNSHPHSGRSKNKLEALDNLVIATIHSLSNKVRISSRQLLEKLQIQHVDNENGALLEEMVSQLKELELSNTNSSPNKSPSRDLSGTLKNLKKLEQVILVLDRVLCDDSGSDANN